MAGDPFASIRDGSSNTIAVVEVSDAAAVPWTKPQDWEPDAANLLKPFDDPRGFLAGFCETAIFAATIEYMRGFRPIWLIIAGLDLASAAPGGATSPTPGRSS